MQNKFYFLLFVLFTIFPGWSSAQKINQPGDSSTQKSLFLNAGFTYVSNLTYGGRYDSSSVPVVAPSVILITRKGFFIGAVGYVDAGNGSYGLEGASITPGFAWHINPKWMAMFSATKYFTVTNSLIILGALNATGDAALYFTPKFINMDAGAEYIFGKSNNDVLTHFEVSKDLKLNHIGEKGKLKISPTIALYAGTQSFYETYYTKQVENKKIIPGGNTSGGLGGLLPGGNTDTSQNTNPLTYVVTQQQQKKINQFNLLSLDLSLPVNFSLGKWQITASPHWLLPFNQPGFTGNGEGDTIFYFTVNTGFTF
jgi:hypothetical protein